MTSSVSGGASGAPAPAHAPLHTPEEHAPSFVGALFWIAIVFSAFQIVTAAYSPISSTVVRAVHVGFLLLLTFLMHPPLRVKGLGWLVGAAAFGAGLYHGVFEADLIQRAGDLTTADMVVGTLTIVLVFEAARRIMGFALPLICLMFLAYGVFGQYLPGDTGAPGLRPGPDRGPTGLWHRRHLRHADLCVVVATSSCSSCLGPFLSRPA